MYHVYIIKSCFFSEKIYVGYTANLKERLAKHNSGGSIYTAPYKPWKLIMCLSFESLAKAKAFEEYLKTSSGKAFALKRLV